MRLKIKNWYIIIASSSFWYVFIGNIGNRITKDAACLRIELSCSIDAQRREWGNQQNFVSHTSKYKLGSFIVISFSMLLGKTKLGFTLVWVFKIEWIISDYKHELLSLLETTLSYITTTLSYINNTV